MKKYTAYDLFNNLVRSEDIYENKSSLGLNKHVQKKFNNVDAIDNVSDYVDLGLPSRTLWCKHNYGVTSEEEYGEYYTFDDAQKLDATVPSSDEFRELYVNCKLEWAVVNGVRGQLFTSELNGGTVFFPAAGNDGKQIGIRGYYWTSNRYPPYSGFCFSFSTNMFNPITSLPTQNGFSVRTIMKRTNESNLGLNKHVQDKFKKKDILEDFDEFVDLGLPSGVRWAKHNVGAATEEEYGDYYAYKDIDKLSRGNVRVPTNTDWTELRRHCTRGFVSRGNGEKGYIVKSKKDPSKYIFLPSAGFARDGKAKSIVASGTNGNYMLSNIYRYTFHFNSSTNSFDFQSFFDFDICRFSVRMVEYPEKKKKSKKIEESSHLGLNKRVQKKFEEKDAIDNISDYVDLGLPSGNLWCKYNVGASSEEEYGDYFKHHQVLEIDTKEGVLPLTHDFLELSLHCEETDETINGVKCHVFTSKQNRERLCFPAAGLNGVKKNEIGSYWAEEPYDKSDNRSCCMSFSLNGVTYGHKAYNDNFNNANELSVKLVLKKNKVNESSVSLGLNKRIQKKFDDKDSVENVSWIPFEDKEVEKVCHEHGVYTIEDAASVTTIIDETQWFKPSWFYDHKIKTFNEFKYFTGLKTVERHAFNFNTTLEAITLPSSIETIGFGAFKDCHHLVKVSMQEGLKTIKTCAFDNCRSLKTLVFPEGLEEIESLVIEGCINIKSVNVPDSVSYIAPTAFNECGGSLNTIYISSNHHLRSTLSKNCPHVALVDPKEVNESNLGLNKHVQKKFQDIDAVDNISEYVDLGLPSGTLWKAYNEGQEDLSDDMLGNTYTQPEAIKEFRDLLPSKDQYEELISQCDWKIVVIDGKKMIEFRSKSNGKTLYFQIKALIQFWTSDEYVYDDFTAGYGFIPIAGIEICPKVYKYSKANDFFVRTVIRKSTSEEKVNESDLGLNKRVQKKFNDVDAIENVSWIPFEDPEVERICHEHGVYTKDDAANVTSVEGWFTKYLGKHHVRLVGTIPVYEQYEIKTFKEFQYFTSIKEIRGVYFRTDFKSSLETIVLPYGTRKIGSNAFVRNSSLENIDIPDTVTEIGEYAFYGVGLKTIVLPDSIRRIKKNAFGRSDLESIVIPPKVTVLEKDMFMECANLKNVSLPNRLKKICTGALYFSNNSNKVIVNIPDTVQFVESNAFDNRAGNIEIHINRNSPVYKQLKDSYPKITFVETNTTIGSSNRNTKPSQANTNENIDDNVTVDQIIQNSIQRKSKTTKSCLEDFVSKDELINWVFNKKYWNNGKFNIEQILKDLNFGNDVDFIFTRFMYFDSMKKRGGDLLTYIYNKEKYIKDLEGKIGQVLPVTDKNHHNLFGGNFNLDLVFHISRDFSSIKDSAIGMLCDNNFNEFFDKNNKEHTQIIYGLTKDDKTFKEVIKSILRFLNAKRNSKSGKEMIQMIKYNQ